MLKIRLRTLSGMLEAGLVSVTIPSVLLLLAVIGFVVALAVIDTADLLGCSSVPDNSGSDGIVGAAIGDVVRDLMRRGMMDDELD